MKVNLLEKDEDEEDPTESNQTFIKLLFSRVEKVTTSCDADLLDDKLILQNKSSVR